MGRSTYACKNLDDLRQHKSKLLQDLTELRQQEQKVKRFETFKHEILHQLLQNYIEFITHLLKFLDARHGFDQQKFVYWTNLKQFTHDVDANTGCDIPPKIERKLDQLFGAIQHVIQSLSRETVQIIQGQLDKSILYQMFIRSNCAYRSILTRSPIRYGDLLSVQRRLLVDMRREKIMDPIIKRFHDEWLVPQLKLQVGGGGGNGEKKDNKDWDETSNELHRLLKKTFRSFEIVTTADELERIAWLIICQWNYLFIECDRRLQALGASTATRDNTHEDDKKNNGQ